MPDPELLPVRVTLLVKLALTVALAEARLLAEKVTLAVLEPEREELPDWEAEWEALVERLPVTELEGLRVALVLKLALTEPEAERAPLAEKELLWVGELL